MGLQIITPGGAPHGPRATERPVESPVKSVADGPATESTNHFLPLMSPAAVSVGPTDFEQVASGTITPDIRQDPRSTRFDGAPRTNRSDPSQLPAAAAEEFASGLLSVTFNKLEEGAARLLQSRAEVSMEGSATKSAALEASISSFLRHGEKVMVDLATNLEQRGLTLPISAAMQRLLTFMKTTLWASVRDMREQMRGPLSNMVIRPTHEGQWSIGDCMEFCSHLERECAESLQQEIQQNPLGKTYAPTAFDLRSVVGLASLLTQVEAARARARIPDRSTPREQPSAEPGPQGFDPSEGEPA